MMEAGWIPGDIAGTETATVWLKQTEVLTIVLFQGTKDRRQAHGGIPGIVRSRNTMLPSWS